MVCDVWCVCVCVWDIENIYIAAQPSPKVERERGGVFVVVCYLMINLFLYFV